MNLYIYSIIQSQLNWYTNLECLKIYSPENYTKEKLFVNIIFSIKNFNFQTLINKENLELMKKN